MSPSPARNQRGTSSRAHMALVLQCCAAGARGADRTYLKHRSIKRAQRLLIAVLAGFFFLMFCGVLQELC